MKIKHSLIFALILIILFASFVYSLQYIPLILFGDNNMSCECSSCAECEYKLNNAPCRVIRLNQDITSQNKTCIKMSGTNASGKIFDCQGHEIRFVPYATSYFYGVHVVGSQNVGIENCQVKNFNQAIFLFNVNNSFLRNNILTDNWNQGIYLLDSSNNEITNNYAQNNWIGFLMATGATNNRLYYNTAIFNKIGYYFGANYNTISHSKGCYNYVNNLPRDVTCHYIAPENSGFNNTFGFVENCLYIEYKPCHQLT